LGVGCSGEKTADWRAWNKSAEDKPRRVAGTKRQLVAAAAEAKWEPYAKKIKADALDEREELKAAVTNAEKAECEGSDSKVDKGKLVGLMKYVLGMQGTSVQRHGNGALVGPDCRRLLEKPDVILGDIRKGMMVARYGETEARDFVNRHTVVLKKLAVVSSITRRVKGAGAGDLLSTAERAELKRACAAFEVAWRRTYHIVEVHVPWFVDRYGRRRYT
jgi:hypothetical protein